MKSAITPVSQIVNNGHSLVPEHYIPEVQIQRLEARKADLIKRRDRLQDILYDVERQIRDLKGE